MTTEVGSMEAADPRTVLVMDSDVLSRLAIAQYLRECGYTVIEAASPKEAMIVLKQSDIEVHVLLSDMASHDAVEGFSLAKWTRDNCPGVVVLLAGTVMRAAEMAGDICDDGPLLSKPYEPQAVLDRIRRLKSTRARGPL